MPTDEVPKVPEPPMIVLAKPRRRKVAFWYYVARGNGQGKRCMARFGYYDWEKPEDLTVIPHPRNDERAVKIIQESKKHV